MSPKKIKKILAELFDNQIDMAEKLGVSQGKISDCINGKQQLHIEGISLLLTFYKIEPEWFFNASDSEPIRFQGSMTSQAPEDRYTHLLEKNQILMEELATYHRKTISSLKNNNLDADKS